MKTYKQKQRNKLLWKYSNKYQKKEHRKTETQNHNRLRHIEAISYTKIQLNKNKHG